MKKMVDGKTPVYEKQLKERKNGEGKK